MLTVACLLNDTQLAEDVKQLVQFHAYNMAATNGYAPLESVYAAIKKDGIEIDMRTVGRIYADTLPLHEAAFNDLTEIDDVVGEWFRDLVNAVTFLPDRNSDQTTGLLAPEQAVAQKLGELFWEANSVSNTSKSDMKIMQDALLKGARRLLKDLPKPAATKKDWQDVINEALSIDKMGIPTLFGPINNMSRLFDALKQELTEISDTVGLNDPIRKAQFDQYIDSLQNASYALMLSKSEAKKLLVDIMKEAGFSKTLPNGNTVLDWNKLSGYNSNAIDIRNNVQKVLMDKGYSQSEINAVKRGLVQEFNNMYADMTQKAADKLIQKGSKRLKSQTRSALQKMVELHHLGVFKSAQKKALYKLLGVDDLTQENIDKIAIIVEKMDSLTRGIKQPTFRGKEFFASHAYKTLRRQISDVIANNVTDKAAILQVIRGLDYYFQVKATGMIMNYGNLFENNLSATKEVLAATINQAVNMGPSSLFKDWELWKATFTDVAKGGIVYGDAGTSFGDFSKAEHAISKKKNLFTKALYYLLSPARYFLTGSDSAFKAILTRKTFQLSLHQALVQSGMSKKDATLYINNALYGQSWEQAKIDAEQILKTFNLGVTKASIVRMAEDLVKSNLLMDKRVTLEMVQAAHKSGYEVAGIGMGHLSQSGTPIGYVAQKLSKSRLDNHAREVQLAKDANYTQLGLFKLYSLGFEQSTLFLGGRLNWLQLRLQSTGWGMISGYFGGDFKNDVDLSDTLDEEQMTKSMFAVRDANQRFYRGMVGTAYSMMFASVVAGIAAAVKDPDDDSFLAFKTLMRKINDNPIMRRMFKKTAPSFMLMYFYKAIAKADAVDNPDAQEAANWAMAKSFGEDIFNIGDKYGTGSKVAEALKLGQQAFRANGHTDTKSMQRAKGMLGEAMFGGMEVPIWRPAKSYYQFGTGIYSAFFGGEISKPTFRPSYDFFDGAMKGGMLEDMGFWKAPNTVLALPGVGSGKEAALKEIGINNIQQLKETPNYLYVKDKNGNLIFTKKDREALPDAMKQW